MIDVFIPCFYRPQNLTELILSLEATATNNEEMKIYFMAAEDDPSLRVIDQFGYMDQTFVDDPNRDMRYVTRIQYMYENSDNDWFLTGSDDIIFHNQWLRTVSVYFDTKYSVIGFNDLCNPALKGTNFAIRRSYIDFSSGVIDEPNRVFCGDYFHNFCDNELVETAESREVFIQCDGIIEHMHPMVNKAEWDDGYEWAKNHVAEDMLTYNQRKHLWGM
jgi:hypothetical protein